MCHRVYYVVLKETGISNTKTVLKNHSGRNVYSLKQVISLDKTSLKRYELHIKTRTFQTPLVHVYMTIKVKKHIFTIKIYKEIKTQNNNAKTKYVYSLPKGKKRTPRRF